MKYTVLSLFSPKCPSPFICKNSLLGIVFTNSLNQATPHPAYSWRKTANLSEHPHINLSAFLHFYNKPTHQITKQVHSKQPTKRRKKKYPTTNQTNKQAITNKQPEPTNAPTNIHMVMERTWKVMEFEICIPGLEKAWKLQKFVWDMEKSWNFRFFLKLFLANG